MVICVIISWFFEMTFIVNYGGWRHGDFVLGIHLAHPVQLGGAGVPVENFTFRKIRVGLNRCSVVWDIYKRDPLDVDVKFLSVVVFDHVQSSQLFVDVFWQLDWFNIEQSWFDPSFWTPQAYQSEEVLTLRSFPQSKTKKFPQFWRMFFLVAQDVNLKIKYR